jgi:hypothetical protein
MQLTELPAESFVFVVWMLDELLHTDEHPYCDDETCPCQESKPVKQANYRRLSSDDFIPEYPCLPQETTWYEC